MQVTTAQKDNRSSTKQAKPGANISPDLNKIEVSKSQTENEVAVMPARTGKKGDQTAPIAVSPNALGTASTTEAEPNDTPATAQFLPTTPVRVRADLFRSPFTTAAAVDVDIYSFTAAAGDRVYAATMTGFSGGSTDTQIDILASDGTTVLETDDEDGTISGSASNIAGTVLATAGTYYVRVRQFTTSSLSGTVRPYDLYVRVLSGTPTPETEPNNNGAPQALAANGWMSGAITPLNDSDTYTVQANAGDTIVTILDVNPERDATIWNARVGIGNFNNNILLANGSAVGGTFDDANPSEALFMTVQTTGIYQVYVDESPTTPTATGAATNTYHLSVSVIPATPRTCTTYTGGTTGPIADVATTNFTLAIPDNRIIGSLQLSLNATHAATADLDVSLISPDGNEVVLFDDPPTTAGATAPQINTTLDDEAAIPISNFGIHSGPKYQPELFARMAYFKGMQAQGTWTLRVRDDLTANTGTVNSWSLTVCDDTATPSCPSPLQSIYSSDFETSDGGFTHSGTQDEWARGLPSGASAPITTCHSGTNCWKTDLTGTYNASSNQDLLSPSIDLTSVTGSVSLSWWQKYQMEAASFDSAYVEVREVGNPANARRVWEWKGATMTRSVGSPAVTVQMSAGWGLMKADISSFAGKNVEVRYHLDSDGTGQFSGFAVDDVSVAACPTVQGGGNLIISEFRLRGPSSTTDEFIELYNSSGSAIMVASTDGTAGYGVAASDGVLRCTIPNGTIIPARGHVLCANSTGYSLGLYPAGNGTTATPDTTYITDIPDNAGLAVFSTANPANFSIVNRLDAVGSSTEANTLYKEGTGYPALNAVGSEYSFYRKNDAVTGLPTDTNNNASDFYFINTDATSITFGQTVQRLGAPGPENLSSPPIKNQVQIPGAQLDPTVAQSGPPNRVRVGSGNSGTLSIRRTYTNNTGAPVTRLRFRIIDITNFPSPAGTADLRATTSTTGVISTGMGNVTVQGLTLETPPAQPNGGGFNSTLSAGTIQTATPLANGATISVNFLMNVNQAGAFRFFVLLEANP
jgi:subtilisin-like proprotein convertase family protein